ncbi:hypothetical protein BGZ89_007448, partial [Linnemannia elongata]
MSRLKGRTGKWARHVVDYVFTAGSVTTQRVENSHSHLKNNLHSKSTLDDVLVMTENRTIKENLKREELCYRREPPHSRWRINSTVDDFHEIVAENNKFLDGFARFKMVDEMTESYFYRVIETELADLEVIDAIFEYQEASDDDEQDHEQEFAQDDQESDREDDGDRDGGNGREKGEEVGGTVPHELRQLAYQDILFVLGQDNVEAVYRV